MFDLIIVGAGVAGLTAAIYAARGGADFIVLEQDGYGGGQISSAHLVENYPGLPSVCGADLSEEIRAHAEKLGAKIEFGIVTDIINNGDSKKVITEDNIEYFSKAVIIATGASPRTLGVPGEDKFLGRGVSYCAVCDGAFYEDKDVFVIGGGDTAVEDAIYLSDICKSVTLVHRREEFRAPKTRVDYLKSKENIKFILNANLISIDGTERVSSVSVNANNNINKYTTDGVFIAVGTKPESSMIKSLNIDTDNGYIKADETCRTNIKGIFAAGDIRTKHLRQVITAAADGANAAISAMNFIKQ
jgi:thioredoxin reductase (NADPH)